ncbi:unnamed protein product [Trichobilharzia regenti]|nr:unnamed protein product [Trichobilharzia regenti]
MLYSKCIFLCLGAITIVIFCISYQVNCNHSSYLLFFSFLYQSEPALHMALMAYKYRLKQAMLPNDCIETGGSTSYITSVSAEMNGSQQMHPHLDFYVDGNMIFVADTTVDRRFSEFFIRQIDLLQQMNRTLDSLERRVHEASIQESAQETAQLRS